METNIEVPSQWLVVPLETVCDVIQGQSPPGNTYNSKGEGLPFFQGKAEFGVEHPTPKKWCSAPVKVAKPGDVLISIRAPVGPANLNAETACIGRGLAALRPLPGIETRYVFYAIRNSETQLALQGTGSTFKAISGGQLRQHKIPIAPTNEQHRIVAEIEKQFTRLDAAVAALKRAQANLKRYRASVLKAACEGRLVPTEAELARAEGRDYEPAQELLKRILKERRARWEADQLAKMKAKGKTPKDDKWKQKYKEPQPVDPQGLPPLPEGWTWASLAHLAWDAGYGTSVKCDRTETNPPVLRIPNIIHRRISFEDLKFATKTEPIENLDPLEPGDLLIIRTNGSKKLLGRCGLVVNEFERPHYFASYLIRFRLTKLPNIAEWTARIFDSHMTRKIIEAKAVTSAGQHNVNLRVLSGVVVPLPPQGEMLRILDTMRRADSLLDELARSARSNQARAGRLRQSILKRAFEGKLVAQNPKDEPASVLLERIHAEREQGSAQQAARRAKPPRKGRARAARASR